MRKVDGEPPTGTRAKQRSLNQRWRFIKQGKSSQDGGKETGSDAYRFILRMTPQVRNPCANLGLNTWENRCVKWD